MTTNEKNIDVSHLPGIIKPGDRIFVSSDPSTPIYTLNAVLNSSSGSLTDLEFIQLATLGEHFTEAPDKPAAYRLKTFRVGETIGTAFAGGHVDFVPTNMAEVAFLFASGAIGVDVAIIQTSRPYGNGSLNLGLVNDLTRVVIENTPLVIAETNPFVPITNGSTTINTDDVDYLIDSAEPLFELPADPRDEIFDKIGWNVANLIDDGSTLSMGAGPIFKGIADNLTGKRDLWIRSHIISDWAMDLLEAGVLARRNILTWTAPIVTMCCVGTKRFYEYVSNNPNFEIVPLLQSKYQAALPKTKKLVSILNADKIDISGDSIIVPKDEMQLPGFDAKLAFSMAANHSRDGKAIVALRSMNPDGSSNITISHAKDTGRKRSTLGSTHYVVTEYGTANIFGKSIRERALAIIDIAHPEHRDALIEEAKKEGFIYKDQIYELKHSLNYPYDIQKAVTFKKNWNVIFRPVKSSDEEMMRRFFYRLSNESKIMRYFSPIHTFKHKEAQSYLNIDYKKTLSLVGIVQQRGIERIIAEGRYAYDVDDDEYELAIAVDEEFQGAGIATCLVDFLLSTASKRGIKRIVAYVLPDNDKMIAVFKKMKRPPEIQKENDQVRVVFYLTDEFSFCMSDFR